MVRVARTPAAAGAGAKAAAFDTRLAAPPVFTGRASKGIAKELRAHGFALVAEPESFLVTKGNQLQAGEEERARQWGARLSAAVTNRAGAAPPA